MKTIKKIALGLSLLAAMGVASADTTVAVLNSSTSLDLSGNFSYALTLTPGAAGTVIGDATFTDAFETPGAAVVAQNYIGGWHPQTFTGSADDVKLASVMSSISWSWANGSADSQVVTLTMSGLTVGNTYQAQLMFGEQCCDRGFNAYRDGAAIFSNVSPFGMTGDYTGSAFLTDTFVATSTSVVYGLGGSDALHGDNNPILNAATLENVTAVPEPESYALLLAGLGLLALMARRKSA